MSRLWLAWTVRGNWSWIPGRTEIFLFSVVFIPQPTQPMGTVALSPVVKQMQHVTDHSLLSSAEVKNAWAYWFTTSDIFIA
jgi:hypothetical protein